VKEPLQVLILQRTNPSTAEVSASFPLWYREVSSRMFRHRGQLEGLYRMQEPLYASGIRLMSRMNTVLEGLGVDCSEIPTLVC